VVTSEEPGDSGTVDGLVVEGVVDVVVAVDTGVVVGVVVGLVVGLVVGVVVGVVVGLVVGVVVGVVVGGVVGGPPPLEFAAVQVSPAGSVLLAAKVMATFQKTSSIPEPVAQAMPTL
jgi:hypothetical protein